MSNPQGDASWNGRAVPPDESGALPPQASEHERAMRAAMLGVALGAFLRLVSRRRTV